MVPQIMPDEVREPLTRVAETFLHPQSLQILQIHSGASSLQFTLIYFLQASFRGLEWP